MSIAIHIPSVLQSRCGGAREISVDARSVADALQRIAQLRPALYESVCDETGAVRRHVNLFVNSSHIRDKNGLDTELAPGDIVTIMPAVSGG